MESEYMTPEQQQRSADQDDFLKRVEDGKKKYHSVRVKRLIKTGEQGKGSLNNQMAESDARERNYNAKFQDVGTKEKKPVNKINPKYQSSIKDLKSKKPLDAFSDKVNKLDEKSKKSVRSVFGE